MKSIRFIALIVLLALSVTVGCAHDDKRSEIRAARARKIKMKKAQRAAEKAQIIATAKTSKVKVRVVPAAPPPVPEHANPFPRTEYSILPKSTFWMRGYHNSKTVGNFTSQIFLNTPMSTYVQAFMNVRSSTASSSEKDFRAFTSSLFFYTPHFHDFGLVGNYSASGSAATNIGRVGPYMRFLIPDRTRVYIVIPALMFQQPNTSSGRFLTQFLFSFSNGRFLLDGNTGYTWSPSSKTVSFDPFFGMRIYQNLRAIVGYSTATTTTGSTSTNLTSYNLGIELRSSF